MWDSIKKIFGGGEETIITEEYLQVRAEFEEGKNLFVTGKAGTGKSKLIEYLRKVTKKKMVVLAPTGLAAINVGGQTIHSFFQFPPKLLTAATLEKIKHYGPLLKTVDTIVIDEASMIRADVLDGMDYLLRKFGRNSTVPFGGTQIILVGDLFQLPPVVTQDEAEAFFSWYKLPYFFGSHVWKQAEFNCHQLTMVFRQKDEEFIRVLNAIRDGSVSPTDLELFHPRVMKLDTAYDGVMLATTNKLVSEINKTELGKLKGKEKSYAAMFEGDFPSEENNLPAEKELWLKKGAHVMLLKNGATWANGTLGKITALGEMTVKIKTENGDEIEVGPERWEKVAYKVEANSVSEKVLGAMTQLPVRLAWAVTIHKSQGMTFEKVRIDFSRSPFSHGQTYVALSRCRTLEGISLSRDLYLNDIIVDPEVVKFFNNNLNNKVLSSPVE